MRLAEEVAILDHLLRGPVACGPGIGMLRKLKEQHQRLGYDGFCVNHRRGTMPPEPSSTSLQRVGPEVIPAFP